MVGKDLALKLVNHSYIHTIIQNAPRTSQKSVVFLLWSDPEEEWELFARIAFKLNQDAKQDKALISFSLRDDGSIWKYQQDDTDGKWKWMTDWNLPGSVTSNKGIKLINLDSVQ